MNHVAEKTERSLLRGDRKFGLTEPSLRASCSSGAGVAYLVTIPKPFMWLTAFNEGTSPY
jgi:hypothetical protein